MRSRGRRLLVRAAWTLAASSFLFALYLRVGIFPGGLREAAIRRIEGWTHKRVVFDRAVFIPFHGLSLTGFGLFEQDGEPIFRARRLTVNARLLPFLREKKIFIDRLLLDGAHYDWVLERASPDAQEPPPKTVISGQIEVPVVPQGQRPRLKDLRYGPDIFLPENVYVERVEVSDATVRVRRRRGLEPSETLSPVNIRLSMPKAPILRFEGKLGVGDPHYASVTLDGSWDLQEDRYAFALHTETEEVPGWLIDYQQGHFLVLREGRCSLDGRIFSGADRTLLFNAKADLKEAVLKLNDARYSGHLLLDAEGVFDGVTKRILKYRGTLDVAGVEGRDVSKKIRELNGLSGRLRFEPDLLTVETMRGRYKKIDFDAGGTLRSFKELRVEGDVVTRIPMDRLSALLPEEHREKWKDFILEGDCEAHSLLSGSLRKDSAVQTDYKLVIRNGSVRNDAKKIAADGLFGEFRMGAGGVRTDQARFNIAGKPYLLSAFIPRDAKQTGFLRLRSNELTLETDYTAQNDDLLLTNGRASFAGGRADFSGKCLHWSDPWLQIHGRVDLDAAKAFARLAKPGKRPELSGRLSGPFTLSGAWDRPVDWDLKADARGTPLYWRDLYRLDDFQIQLRMKNRRCEAPFIRAKAYGGTLTSRLRLDLVSAGPLFDLELNLNSLDLSRIGPELKPPKPELKGTLLARVALEGKLSDPSTYRGEGVFSITDGFLWQTARFKNMGTLPLVRVEGLDWVTFQEASATFRVRDRKIRTSDLTLLGDAVDLSMEGAVGFEGSLDMVMDIRYSNAILEGAAITGGFVPLVVQQAGNAISQYHVGGTLRLPEYEKMLLPTPRGAARKLAGALRAVAP